MKYVWIACTLLLALTGCLNAGTEHEKEQPFSNKSNTEGKESAVKLELEDFEGVLQSEGLELMPYEEKNDWILNNVKPNRFTVGRPNENTDPAKLEKVSVYIFNSEKARMNGLEDFNKQKEQYDMMIPRIYSSTNILVFYWAEAQMDKPAKYEEQFQNAIQQLDRIES